MAARYEVRRESSEIACRWSLLGGDGAARLAVDQSWRAEERGGALGVEIGVEEGGCNSVCGREGMMR